MSRRLEQRRRRHVARHTVARRMLLGGAVVGLIIGVASTAWLEHAGLLSHNVSALARLAMVAPVAIYLIWWFSAPGFDLGEQDVLADLDPNSIRAADPEAIAAAFDASADQQGEPFAPLPFKTQLAADDPLREHYARSIRRPAASAHGTDLRPAFHEHGHEHPAPISAEPAKSPEPSPERDSA